MNSKNKKPHHKIDDERVDALINIDISKKNLRQAIAFRLMISLACRA